MQTNYQETEQEKTLTELLMPYLMRWKWILVGLVIFFAGAYIFLRYSTPQYQTTTRILIKDEKRGQSAMDVNVFQDLGIASSSGNIDNEIEVLRSRTLQLRVADSLDLDIGYYREGRLKASEIYMDSPVVVNAYEMPANGTYWRIDMEQEGKLKVTDLHENTSWEVSPGQIFSASGGKVYLSLTDDKADFPVWVRFQQWEPGTQISINSTNKLAGVVDMSMVSANPKKSEDILNTLVLFYNKGADDDKKWVTQQTINFIDERLKDISKELADVEKRIEDYKKKNKLADIEVEVGLSLTSGSEYEKRIPEIMLQKAVLSTIEDYITDEKNNYNAIPTDLGITDASLLALIDAYNEMQLKRRNYVLVWNTQSPIIIDADNNLNALRRDILNGIRNANDNYESMISSLKVQENVYSDRIKNFSTNEREFQELIRQKEHIGGIYMYLLQKREESAISLTMVSSNAKVIDAAYTNPIPVKPKRSIIYLLAFILGILVPMGIIYLFEMFNNKIRTKDDLEKVTKAPVLGMLADNKTDADIIIEEGDRSGEVELYRLLSTNLEFVLAGDDEKVIMVTSSVPSEGKSSFSLNLALTWATVGKKVLLVDLDMRNSRVKDIFNIPSNTGMSTYLSGKTSISEVIFESGVNKNLKVAPSGAFPPNPVQLIQGERLGEFIEKARKEYDIIVVDTPPVLLVTDALLINKYVDATVYVTRSGVTNKQYLKVPEELSRTGKLKNLSYVIKGIQIRGGYGYGYGYGYGDGSIKGKKNWKNWNNILQKKKH